MDARTCDGKALLTTDHSVIHSVILKNHPFEGSFLLEFKWPTWKFHRGVLVFLKLCGTPEN